MPCRSLRSNPTFFLLLAAQRDPESYVAGDVPLNPAGPRFSNDVDIFHDREESVAIAAAADTALLEKAGFMSLSHIQEGNMVAKQNERCRMITQDGHQCSRNVTPGGMGFCWQHVPVQNNADREKWKLRIEGAALAVASVEVLLKIIELAVEHLPEFFGSGDDQTRAKHEIQAHFPVRYPSFGSGEFEAGARVDWKTLLKLFRDAKRAADDPGAADYQSLESRFDEWFDQMNDFHKGELLKAISKDVE